MTSPRKSSGVTTSTLKIGSSRIGLARLAAVLLGQHLCNGRGQRRLAVVDVTNRADVDVRLVALELLLRHSELPLSQSLLRAEPELAKHTLYAEAPTGSPVRVSTISSAMLPGTSSYLSNCIV